ncbi:GXWXG domain-containing protein [Geodermatophilus sp. SYSU D00742]
MTGDDAVRWLARHRGRAAPVDALAFFDRLPAVAPEAVVGRWRGAELPTGSRLDGLLTAHGWWGKEVVDADTVHPLLFTDRAGRPRPVQPAPAPLTLLRRAPRLAASGPARLAFAAARPLLRTRRPAARIRAVAHRGVVTAAVVYDRLPVVDVLRAVTADVLLGLMDLRGLPEPYFFVLERDAG